LLPFGEAGSRIFEAAEAQGLVRQAVALPFGEAGSRFRSNENVSGRWASCPS